MADFTYNNAKNIVNIYALCKLNCKFHPQFLFEENINLYSRFYSANKLAKKQKKLMEICCQNLL